MKLYKLLLVFVLFSFNANAQDAARNWTVQLTAEVNYDPEFITLNWLPNENETPNQYYVFRKEKGTAGWGVALATLDSDILTFTDLTAVKGISYEYYLQLRLGASLYAWGFVNSGIDVPLSPNKGDLLLIVDETIAPELSGELDVTFNGYHILNNDLVDPRSEILITLKDENEFLIMEDEADTANFGIYLSDPEGVQHRLNFRNSLGEPLMEWIPADASNKKFKIVYDGDFEMNGVYRLLVQAVDKSGNISGDFEYDIEFEVDHNSSITYLMNYPNPFSTSTQFVFTLTGSKIPDEFTIQIMTITGKVVREITKDELGTLKIGRNITEFAWNGTDEFGDALANGIYLYRVIVKIDNEAVELRESGADKYFTKEFGKMYLMR